MFCLFPCHSVILNPSNLLSSWHWWLKVDANRLRLYETNLTQFVNWFNSWNIFLGKVMECTTIDQFEGDNLEFGIFSLSRCHLTHWWTLNYFERRNPFFTDQSFIEVKSFYFFFFWRIDLIDKISSKENLRTEGPKNLRIQKQKGLKTKEQKNLKSSTHFLVRYSFVFFHKNP